MQVKSIQVLNLTLDELTQLIGQGVKLAQSELRTTLVSESIQTPHLTRKETATYFNISLNCLNMWVNKGILKSYKVGQRVFFKREEILQVMFNQSKTA
jgi:excisionase family DNA binding protein